MAKPNLLILALAYALASVVVALPTPAVAVAIDLVPVFTGLTSPVLLTHAGDGSQRRFIVEQAGVIKVAHPGQAPTVFLDIKTKVIPGGGERGLLGLAFHPDYATNGRFFVNYIRASDGHTLIAEYQVSAGNPDVADTTETPLLVIQQPPFSNHKAGMLAFGPDGFLYIAVGDGGSGNDPGNRAQNINELLGKILRIDVDTPNGGQLYSSPPSNPYFGATPGRDEIYAVGMRNPWRLSFDRDTGDLYVGDVGQGAVEEIDIVTLGGNYGWRIWEGSHCTGIDPSLCSTTGFTFPIAEYAHAGGRCSVTGGYVYRGALSSLPVGSYVYADYCTGEIFLHQSGVSSVVLDTGLNISSFGEDEAGEIYVVGLGGTVHRVAAGFDYALANGGGIAVVPGASGTTTITASLLSGTSQSVSLAVSGLPDGATASFSPGAACVPTCAPTLMISTTAATPQGTFPITVTGTPLGRTTGFTLAVVLPNAPAAVSVTPGSGSGASQTFSYVFAHGSGFAEISSAQLVINNGLSAANGCYLFFARAANTIWLANDAGTQYVGSKPLGVAGTLQNSQCVVDAGASAASGTGNTLTLNLALSFKAAFAGAKSNFMFAADNAGQFSGWQAKGTWTVPAVGNAPPTATSVSPGSGSGISQMFSYVFTDTNGFADISSTQLVINGSLSAANGCYLLFARAANAIWLANDAGTQFVGPLTLGTQGTLQNSQCIMDAAASSAPGTGNTLTLNIALSFKAAFAGAKTNFMLVYDNAGQTSGWQARGTWTVPAGANAAPTAVSVTPGSGSGASQTFSYAFSDTNGFSDISSAQVVINNGLIAANGCYLFYARAANTIWLANDAGTQYVGSRPLGVAGTLQNSQCVVNAGASSSSGTGNTLTLNVALTFKPGFAGAKTNFMFVADEAGQFSGWQARGTWTAP